MIEFNIPYRSQNEEIFLKQAIQSGCMSGDGDFVKKCEHWFNENYKCKHVFMTHSCTGALEMAALCIDIHPGDEVIVPSFTHISTANAFVLRGAKIVFADILPGTMCIDAADAESKISSNTKAIVAVHYGGYAADLDQLSGICKKHSLFLIEDAAHSIGAKLNDKYLGTIGDIGCLSFHETKNIHCGEGGALLLNNETLLEKAEQIYEKGSNRSAFLKKEVEEYTWTSEGSSFSMNNLSAAYLYSQFRELDITNSYRLEVWNWYYEELKVLIENKKIFQLPPLPGKETIFNAHIFFLKCQDSDTANAILAHLNERDISAHRHFPPLHKSPFGQHFGSINCPISESEYPKLIRLPMHTGIKKADIKFIANSLAEFLSE